MSRLRITLMSAATMVALAALTLNSLAQPPGAMAAARVVAPGAFSGRGGGPGGPGGFGGPMPLLMLASNPAVQEDMKLKDKQKAQIKSLNDKFSQQSRELRTQMGGGFGGPGGPGGGPGGPGGGQNAQAIGGGANAQGKGGRRQGQNGQGNGNGQGDVNGQANGQVAQGAGGVGGGFGGGYGGGFGGYGGGFGGQVQVPNGQGINPNQGQGGRGNRGPGGQQDPERAQQFAMMREAMNELTQNAEASLGKILDKSQAVRLKQIQLQLQGPGVIMREDMMEKLGIDESQIQMLEEVRSGHRDAQRENRAVRVEIS